MTYRVKVLGRALLSVRTDANKFWMLLSGNAEVAVPSTTASLPTPATVATATSNAVDVAAGTSNAVDAAAAAAAAAVTVTVPCYSCCFYN
jgi:hypothetical protein